MKRTLAARAMPRTPLGSLQRSPDPTAGGYGAPKNPTPALGFRSLFSALPSSNRPSQL